MGKRALPVVKTPTPWPLLIPLCLVLGLGGAWAEVKIFDALSPSPLRQFSERCFEHGGKAVWQRTAGTDNIQGQWTYWMCVDAEGRILAPKSP